jgi:hypothetical protein
VQVGFLKILYRNPRRPGEAGMKLVPDQSRRAAEKEILEGLGFTVIEMTPAPFTQAPYPAGQVVMDKDRIAGAAKEIKGSVKDAIGKAVG